MNWIMHAILYLAIRIVRAKKRIQARWREVSDGKTSLERNGHFDHATEFSVDGYYWVLFNGKKTIGELSNGKWRLLAEANVLHDLHEFSPLSRIGNFGELTETFISIPSVGSISLVENKS